MFHKLIISLICRGSLSSEQHGSRRYVKKCISWMPFGLSSNMLCSCYVLMDVRTWRQLTLCLREVKGEEQTWKPGEDFSGSRNIESYEWLSLAPWKASDYYTADFMCTWKHTLYSIKDMQSICLAQCWMYLDTTCGLASIKLQIYIPELLCNSTARLLVAVNDKIIIKHYKITPPNITKVGTVCSVSVSDSQFCHRHS